MNRNHYPIPAEVTGEVPLASFGDEFGGRDDTPFTVWRMSGNLDAPMLIAAGSTRNHNVDGVPASSNVNRG